MLGEGTSLHASTRTSHFLSTFSRFAQDEIFLPITHFPRLRHHLAPRIPDTHIRLSLVAQIAEECDVVQTHTRVRTCTNPKPSCEGKACKGNNQLQGANPPLPFYSLVTKIAKKTQPKRQQLAMATSIPVAASAHAANQRGENKPKIVFILLESLRKHLALALLNERMHMHARP